MTGGFILLGLGIVFLLNNFDVVDISESWPVILVVVGLALVVGAFGRDAKKAKKIEVTLSE